MTRRATATVEADVSRLSSADQGIPTLETALSISRMEPLIRKTLAAHGENDAVRLTDCELLRVRPGRRCVLRYTMTAADGSRPLTLAAKIRVKGVNRRVEVACQTLRAQGFAEGGKQRFIVAEPLGSIDPLHMNLVRWYSGQTLQDQLSQGAAQPATFQQMGAALAELHSAAVPAKRVHRLEDELSILQRDLGRAASACPQYASRIAALLQKAEAVAANLEPLPERLVHRDFHPDQILDGPDGLTLLDLDLHARSDPRVDVGNFIAHLREQGLRERGDLYAYAILEQTFLKGYQTTRTDVTRDPMAGIDAWTFLSIVRHLYIAWRIPERRDVLPALLDACESSARELR